MSQFAENKFANILLWLAFFAFGMHSLQLGHCHKGHFDACGSCIRSLTKVVVSPLASPIVWKTIEFDTSLPFEEEPGNCVLVFNVLEQAKYFSLDVITTQSFYFLLINKLNPVSSFSERTFIVVQSIYLSLRRLLI